MCRTGGIKVAKSKLVFENNGILEEDFAVPEKFAIDVETPLP
jgi:hypothetical protein